MTLVRPNTYLCYSFMGLKCAFFLMSHYLISIVLIKCLHTIVVSFHTMCSYSELVEDIEHYNASIGGEFDVQMNSFKHIKLFL